jgi:hypothetical protein
VRFVVALLSSLRSRVDVALVVAEVSFVHPSLRSVYLMRKSPNPVLTHVVVAPRLSSCSCRGRTHIRVCTACRQGLDDVRLPIDDIRLPPSTLVYPLHVHAFAPFTHVRCCHSHARSVSVTVHSRCFARAIIRANH